MDPKPETAAAPSAASTTVRVRIIKRYSNRKLYDTKDSRYVTLLQIAEMVRGGEEVQIIDNNTKDDLTEITLAQIIYEEQKAHSRSVPLQTLKELIHARTEKVLADLREGPIGRLIPGVEAGGGESRRARTGQGGQAHARRSGQGEARGGAAPPRRAQSRPSSRASGLSSSCSRRCKRLNERIEELEKQAEGRPAQRRRMTACGRIRRRLTRC